ncbi:MAG: hypothetical protein V4819_19010 [Verrucomicrobiota bacterium]
MDVIETLSGNERKAEGSGNEIAVNDSECDDHRGGRLLVFEIGDFVSSRFARQHLLIHFLVDCLLLLQTVQNESHIMLRISLLHLAERCDGFFAKPGRLLHLHQLEPILGLGAYREIADHLPALRRLTEIPRRTFGAGDLSRELKGITAKRFPFPRQLDRQTEFPAFPQFFDSLDIRVDG